MTTYVPIATDDFCEQVMRHLSESLVEEGPVVAILDGNGGCWSTAPQTLEHILGHSGLTEFCHRVADGWEPATGLVDGWAIAAGQLHTNGEHRGYVIIGLPDGAKDSAACQSILEMLLNQVSTIAELVHAASRPSTPWAVSKGTVFGN